MKTDTVIEVTKKALIELERLEGLRSEIGLCAIIKYVGGCQLLTKMVLKFNNRSTKLDFYCYNNGAIHAGTTELWYKERKSDLIKLISYLENEHRSENIYLKDIGK